MSIVLKCDLCGELGGSSWEFAVKPIRLHCPEDGINGGLWNYDMCARCRVEINQAIKSAVIRCQSLAKVGGA
jgi:hypothetical protein